MGLQVEETTLLSLSPTVHQTKEHRLYLNMVCVLRIYYDFNFSDICS